MIRVQAALLLSLAIPIGAAEAGEAGLAALAAQRSAVSAVDGRGVRTVQRIGEDDAPVEKREVRFAVASDGRYEIVITSPDDPAERTRLVSDGRRAASQEWTMPDEAPVVKALAVGGQDLLQRLLSCLRLDLAALKSEYAVELRPAGPGLRELSLVPTAPAVAREVASVTVAIDDAGRPVRVVLIDTSGERHRLDVTAFSDDPQLDPARFALPGQAEP